MPTTRVYPCLSRFSPWRMRNRTDKDEARALLEQFAGTDFELPMDTTWLTGMIAYADAAIECGDPLFAAPILERLAPFADQWLYTDVATSGPVSRSLGGLATDPRSLRRGGCLISHTRPRPANEQARSSSLLRPTSCGERCLLNAVLQADVEKARDLLTKAQTAAVAHGYGNVERRAAEALQLLDA